MPPNEFDKNINQIDSARPILWHYVGLNFNYSKFILTISSMESWDPSESTISLENKPFRIPIMGSMVILLWQNTTLHKNHFVINKLIIVVVAPCYLIKVYKYYRFIAEPINSILKWNFLIKILIKTNQMYQKKKDGAASIEIKFK